jgi:hypothetical protein
MTTPQLPYLAEERNDADPVIRSSDLLSASSSAVSERSGGPPYPGAILQDDEDGEFVWSQVLGYYRLFEDGTKRYTEDGIARITG